MKLCVLFTFLFSFSVVASTHAQQERINLDLKDVSLKTLFGEIQKQTSLSFVYNTELTSDLGVFSVQAKDEMVKDVLQRVLAKTGLTYKFEGDIIVIQKTIVKGNEEKSVTVTGKVTDTKKQSIPGVTVQVKGISLGTVTDVNGQYKLTIPNLKEFTLLFTFVGMKSQERKYVGQDTINVVMEEDISELEEVTVVSTGYGDIDRRRLTSAVTSLKMDDIKVAGLSSVDKMLEGHVPGMIFMQNSGQVGAAPKVRIRGTSTVLGSQEPLWVLDGVVLSDPVNVDPASLNDLDFVNLLGNAISGLNPDDIEQIDVLKDAAATAIYGVRAANGVIVITTKKGKAGPPTVTYSLSGTLNRRPYYSDREIYLMNSRERVQVSREMFERGFEFQNVVNWVGYEAAYMDFYNGLISFDEFKEKANYYETINTDWFDILCENSFSNKHTLSVSGGSQNMKYYVSVGYNDERGVIKGELNRNYTASLKLNGNFQKVDFQFAVQGNTNKREYTPTTGDVNIIQYAYEMSRAIPAYNPDGSRWFYQKGSSATYSYPFNIENEIEKTYQEQNTSSVTFTGNVKYRLLPVLNIEGTASYTTSNTNQETVYEEGSWYVSNLRKTSESLNECPVGGELQVNNTRMTNYMLRLQLNYNQQFKDIHNLNVSLGGEMSSKEYNGLKEVHRGYYPGRGKSFGTLNDSKLSTYTSYRAWLAGNKPVISEQLTNLMSAYLSITYTYDRRYTLNFNTRIDGSNQFGSRSNEKLLPIWSLSGRWDIKEDLCENSNFVNSLALKLSYGHQGNMLDNQTSKMVIEKGEMNNWYKDFQSTIKYYPNPDLKWELTSSYNVDLEFSLWKNKVGGSIGYYYKHTRDAFLSKQVSEINGVSTYVVNKGELSNQGLEVTLKLVPIDQKVNASGKRGFVWRVDPQIGQVVNKLISKAINNRDKTLTDKVTYEDYIKGTVELIDKPLNTFYSYRFKGLSPEDGHPLFHGTEEENKEELFEKYRNMTDEEVWETVLVESGTRVPTLQGGISNYIGYGQFGLSFNFTYSLGNKIRMLKLCSDNNIRPYPEKNIRKEFVNRWQRPGDELKTTIPSLVVSEINNTPWWRLSPYYGNATAFAGSDIYSMYDNSDLRVVSGDYLKLQSLSFRYNVHDSFCKKVGIRSAYLSISGTNLFTIANKKLKGQDVTQSGSAPTINLSLRPNYSFTLNVTF